MRLHQGSPQEYKVKKGILSRTYPQVSGAYHGVSAAYSPILGVFRGKRGGVSAALEPHLLFCKPKKPWKRGMRSKRAIPMCCPTINATFGHIGWARRAPCTTLDFWVRGGSMREVNAYAHHMGADSVGSVVRGGKDVDMLIMSNVAQ